MRNELCPICQGYGYGETYVGGYEDGQVETRACFGCRGSGFNEVHASPKPDPKKLAAALEAAVAVVVRAREVS